MKIDICVTEAVTVMCLFQEEWSKKKKESMLIKYVNYNANHKECSENASLPFMVCR